MALTSVLRLSLGLSWLSCQLVVLAQGLQAQVMVSGLWDALGLCGKASASGLPSSPMVACGFGALHPKDPQP